jgi:hypothetical protein
MNAEKLRLDDIFPNHKLNFFKQFLCPFVLTERFVSFHARALGYWRSYLP